MKEDNQLTVQEFTSA